MLHRIEIRDLTFSILHSFIELLLPPSPPLKRTIRMANLSVKTFHTDWRGRTSERTFVPAFRKGMSHHLQFVIVIIILKFLPSTSAACA